MNRITATPAVLAIAIAVAACDTTRPIEHGAETADCGRCHGFPPATVASGGAHPSGTDCSTCHPGTVAPDGTLVAGGLHMNGSVEASGAPHATEFLQDHPAAALAGIGGCASCHGADYGGGTTGVSCNDCHAAIAASGPDWKTNCTFCHGTRTAGVTSATPAAAPPQAVAGATSASDPTVGAHQAHLVAGTWSNPLPCASCHVVPTGAEALTHFSGGGAPGAISFSALATRGVTGAAYTGGTCNVYCHGAGTEFANPAGTASPAWTATSVSCGSCHGVPPASGPTVSGQTAHAFHVSARGLGCATCHPVPPGQLDLHVNGAKDVVVQPAAGPPQAISGWDCTVCHAALGVAVGHATPFVSQHASAALADLGGCASCHGADYGGGTAGVSCNACHGTFGFSDWKTNCTFCHGTRTQGFAGTPVWLPAPPEAVAGATATSDRGVGAHQRHVGNGSVLSDGVACTECHPAATDLAHVGGSGTAQLAWGALATNGGATASMTNLTCANYCHGATLPGTGRTPPTWAPPSTMTCGSCHQANPTTGEHPSQNSRHGFGCSTCHGSGFTAGASVNTAVHVDGAIFKDPSLNWQGPPQFTTKSCDPACHNRKNW